MKTAESLNLQWQELKDKRQQLIDKIDQLKRKLRGLTEEASMKQLLEEKQSLTKKIPELTEQVHIYKMCLEGTYEILEDRRQALTDESLQKDFATRSKRRRQELSLMEGLCIPQAIIENQKRRIFEIEAPIEEVEKFYQRMNAAVESKCQHAQLVLDETLERITAIETYYRQTRRCLEAAVRETEQKKHGCRTEEIEWATQSRSHLEWMLQHEPSYKDEVVHRYRGRFPTESLSDLLLPNSVAMSVVQRAQGKKRKTRPTSLLPTVPTTLVIPQAQTWRLWVTFNANDLGQELPQARDQFLSSLQLVLDKVSYYSLDVILVYDKLLAISRMSKQQRQEMNKVMEAEPLGWKILRIGKKHRLFLLIDEEQQHIRFLPCPRKNSYTHH